MKNIQRSLLVSLIPLLAPLSLYAQNDQSTELAKPVAGTKGNDVSWRASQVMGIDVKNASDETIGEIEDLILDLKSEEIMAVVISSGGFLGIADNLSAVPFSVLRYDSATKSFKTKLTKEQLGKAPQFTKSAWPDYSQVATMESLRSYRDSIGGDVSAPDNSAQNEKMENKEDVIPTDQGNSEKDLQITKDIRAAIVATDLSFNAKNIKIITRNESVTLKGVVDSKSEHEAIVEIAKKHANSAKITDRIKVK